MSYDLNRQKEINEAISAGERALNSLNLAKDELQRARNWGFADMLGGGGLITLAKHSKIHNAENYINQAKYDLQTFSREVSDVNSFEGVDLGIGDFLTFADFFFDGIIADFMVQQKINEAAAQVDEAIRRVRQVLQQLRNM